MLQAGSSWRHPGRCGRRGQAKPFLSPFCALPWFLNRITSRRAGSRERLAAVQHVVDACAHTLDGSQAAPRAALPCLQVAGLPSLPQHGAAAGVHPPHEDQLGCVHAHALPSARVHTPGACAWCPHTAHTVCSTRATELGHPLAFKCADMCRHACPISHPPNPHRPQ